MILEDATKEAFGYYASELKPHSRKSVLAACELCGEFRILGRDSYRTFCLSCSRTLNGKSKGKRNPMFAKQRTRKWKKHHSARMTGEKHPNFGKRGAESSNYKGGAKVVHRRSEAKRKRELGYTPILPLEIGEVGHHIDNEHVIGVPEDVHISLSGMHDREKHRALVLEWLRRNNRVRYKIAVFILGGND